MPKIADQRRANKASAAPKERGERAAIGWRSVDWLAAEDRDRVNVAADRAEVAHEAADEGDCAAIGRYARLVQLGLGRRNAPNLAGTSIDTVELGDPPIVVAIAER